LQYAARGLLVFPLAPGTIKPCKGSHGYKDATRDPDVIRRWWWQTPRANIGIATGAVSGLLILDVDPRHDGPVSLAALEQKHGRLPPGANGEHPPRRTPLLVPVAREAGSQQR
jgi:Bifunctional DNA primase/polymerase, N-terminal